MLLVSIINHNSDEDTIKLVSTLKKMNAEGEKLSICIIDNSTIEQSKIKLLNGLSKISKIQDVDEFRVDECPDLCVVSTENHGFGSGHNISLEILASSDKFIAVWILNTDIKICTKTLNALKELLHTKDYSILGSRIIENRAGKIVTLLGTTELDNFKGYREPKWNGKKIVLVDAVVGTSMIVKKNVANAGLRFDPSYFMYVEENDFCLQAMRNGFKSVTVYDSVVHHIGGKTFKNNDSSRWYYKVRNILHFKKKNFGDAGVVLAIYLFFATLKNFGLRGRYIYAYFHGVFDFWIGRFYKNKRLV